MQDNFDLYEYKNQLREQSLSGLDATTKVIEYLRSKIYPKLSDDEMDKFIIAIADHLSLDIPSYRLDEGQGQTIKLDDLTFDLLGKKPMFGFDAQNADDSSTKLHNDDDLERWSSKIKSKYGNVDIKIDLDASDEIQVLDKKFQDDKEQRIAGKGRWLDDMGTNV